MYIVKNVYIMCGSPLFVVNSEMAKSSYKSLLIKNKNCGKLINIISVYS